MKSQQRWLFGLILAGSLSGALPVFAQDPNPAPAPPPPPPSGGWRRFDQNNPPANNTDAQQPGDPDQAPPPPRQLRPRYQAAPPVSNAPVHVTIPAGTWITVHVSEPISSDHNQKGDGFNGTLARPLIADGHVIAHAGQMVSGVVSQAEKAGRVKGVSKLGLEVTEIALADGRQVPVKTTLNERRGDTSVGRDAAAIGTTTGAGAAIGAAVNGGVGAGVGAGAGLVVSTIGVLLTRGRQTVVYPEQALTFRLETPITVDGTEAAFHPATEQDYEQRPARGPGPSLRYGPGYPARYYGYAYPGPYYPYYPYYAFGPRFYFGYRGWGRRW